MTPFNESVPVTVSELDNRLRALEQRLTIKLGGMMIVAVGIILAALKYVPPGH